MTRVHLLVAASVSFIVLAGILALSAPAAAQTNNSTLNDTAPYYDNQSEIGNQTDWLPQNISLDSIGEVSSRLGPFVIGSGQQIPGGTTYAGTIVTGLLMVAIFIGGTAFTSLGAAGGAVVASVAGYGLIELGLAPSWLRVVILLIIGIIAAVAIRRTTS